MAGESSGAGGAVGSGSAVESSGGEGESPDASSQVESSQREGGSGDREESQSKTSEAAAVAKAATEAKRRMKVKLEGKEEEWDEDKVIAFAQKGAVADKRFREAAEERRATKSERAQLDRLAKEGTFEDAVEFFGKERFHELSEQYWRAVLEEEDLAKSNPKELELRKKERELAKKEQQFKAREQATQTALQAKLEEQYVKQYDQDITKALQESKLPKNAYSVGRMVDLMKKNLEMVEAGELAEPLPAKTIAKIVQDEMQGSVVSLLGEMDEDSLGSILGETISSKLRSFELKKVKSPLQSKGKSQAKDGDDKKETPFRRRRTMKEGSGDSSGYNGWKERLARIKAGQE